MILLSPGGRASSSSPQASTEMIVGTVDGIECFSRAGTTWRTTSRGLEGVFVSSLTSLESGRFVAGLHGFGVAVSDDRGRNWALSNRGLAQLDVWVVNAHRINGREVLFAGTLPAHLFRSDDGGANWTEVGSLLTAPSASEWSFPPAPHVAHVLDVAALRDVIWVGVEVGALLRSDDCGVTFQELAVNDDVSEVDIHRIILNEAQPDRVLVATGWGMIVSDDRGKTWRAGGALPGIDYPVPFVGHPEDANLLFVAGGRTWPPNWYELGRSRARIARSRDGGATWEHLLGGLPEGQRATYGALALDAWPHGFDVFAADTDGQIFESGDGGDSWQVVAETAPVSKGDQFRGLAKGAKPSLGVHDLVFTGAGLERVRSSNATH
jgi:hypothetical protein